MANIRSGNSFWVDTSSSSGTAGSWIAEKGIKILGIVWTPALGTNVINIYDRAASSDAAGSQKLRLSSDEITHFLNFNECPIICPNGIWVTLTGSPTLTIIVERGAA